MVKLNISFAGSGRVAGSLAIELFKSGCNIELIVSESEKSCSLLAEKCNAAWSTELNFSDSTNLIIVAVPDHRLKKVMERINCSPETIVVHTAGSFGLEVFPENLIRKGIFYPLQTFSKGREVVYRDLPFLLESSDNKTSAVLESLVFSLGGKVYFVDNEHRKSIHLAAVFVCNFVNHMLTMGKSIALKAGFPYELLVPLINETVEKAINLGPENSQTGPAIRNDEDTIEKHLELLSFSPEFQKIYKEITLSIIKHHKKQ